MGDLTPLPMDIFKSGELHGAKCEAHIPTLSQADQAAGRHGQRPVRSKFGLGYMLDGEGRSSLAARSSFPRVLIVLRLGFWFRLRFWIWLFYWFWYRFCDLGLFSGVEDEPEEPQSQDDHERNGPPTLIPRNRVLFTPVKAWAAAGVIGRAAPLLARNVVGHQNSLSTSAIIPGRN